MREGEVQYHSQDTNLVDWMGSVCQGPAELKTKNTFGGKDVRFCFEHSDQKTVGSRNLEHSRITSIKKPF